jgi:polygalacturonase
MSNLIPLSFRSVATIMAVATLVCCTSWHVGLAAGVTPVLPKIPNRTVNIIEHGAKGDGKTLNSAAIQKAIDTASAAGGGTVVVPTGTFISGPVKLKSNINFQLAKGAVLQMSENVEDYPVQKNDRQNFISAVDAHDVQVSGEGLIDGKGESWWTEFRRTKGTPEAGPRRPQMLVFTNCERVRLSGFQTKDPPNCHVAMGGCTDVIIEGLTMTAPDESSNTDALNLRVRNCVIRKCNISTGDDNIVLLATRAAPDAAAVVDNIAISDCALGNGHGLSIGSYTSGGIRNVTCENITFEGTSSGIRMKASRDRGGVVENISYKNITMKNVRYPISISSYYPKEPKSPLDDQEQPVNASTPIWRHITIENVTVVNENLAKLGNVISIWGVPEQPITDVTLKNVRITGQKGGVVYNAKNIRFENVEINTTDGPKLTTFNAAVEGMEATPLEAAGGKGKK